MHSIQTKTILLNVLAIAVAVTAATVISAVAIAKFGHESSSNLLKLSCETGKNNLDDYFVDVAGSVDKISEHMEADLNSGKEFVTHMQEAESYFTEAVGYTRGVLTYYYRIDPAISDAYLSTENELLTQGFYYERYTIDEDSQFKKTTITDLHSNADGTKKEGTEWFFDYTAETNPERKSKWLPPYTTATLGAYVISYNAPVYKGNEFYGVVGIEINYRELGEQIKDIKVHKTGFAYLVDEQTATLIYHPDVDLIETKAEERPPIPSELIKAIEKGQEHFEYTFEKVKKHACWKSLENGMCIVVAVPLQEVNNTWISVMLQIIIIGIVIMAVFVVISIFYSRHFTKPLRELTEVAEEINEGNYDARINYKGNDEIGILTTTVNKLVDHLGGYISDLNSLAYADALTSVRNKSAFDLHVAQIQNSIDNKERPMFAIAILDCDDLKDINDAYGHDKGDVYLRNSCHLICRVFTKSPVFRIGGDEFAVILQNEDYYNKEKLRKYFIEKSAEISSFAKEPWEQIRVAVGIAEFNPSLDKSVEEVVVRADRLMYENKRERKKK